ncbi:sensor histidine kinase [Burkholderia multivorans]|uniref:sensor histidine kinase n=1 Tax=Burkholderia multivorans TaxID=87883 RepID=UPI0021BF0AFB|nr:HAMP domain-containing sensor histidine kinase [Burkholderia multivorans]
MEKNIDAVLAWQVLYFKSITDDDLIGRLAPRMEGDRLNANFYGLFSPNGQHLAGDILVVPNALPADGGGHTLKHTLHLAGSVKAPIVRAMTIVRPDGRYLVLARDMTEVLRMHKTMIRALIGGGLFCLILSLTGGVLLSLRQIRRVKAIRRVTTRIAQGDLAQRLPTGGRDELDMLAHLVNHMMEEVERLMDEVKSACDGIAHDLRTPLAHIRTLLDRVGAEVSVIDNTDVSIMIEQARDETNALLGRFRAIMRISEIGALKRRGGFAAMNIGELVRELTDLYEPLAEEQYVRWTVSIEDNQEIYGDRELLFEALSNILDNAIKFSPMGGEVRIVLSRTTNGPQFDVSDDGPGIPEDERSAVTQHSYRSRRTSKLAGNGLGLSIVAAVLRLHDFMLKIEDVAGLHGRTGSGGTLVRVECWPHSLR